MSKSTDRLLEILQAASTPAWQLTPMQMRGEAKLTFSILTEGEPLLKLEIKGALGGSEQIMNLPALDEHIAELIKHRDLLAELVEKQKSASTD